MFCPRNRPMPGAASASDRLPIPAAWRGHSEIGVYGVLQPACLPGSLAGRGIVRRPAIDEEGAGETIRGPERAAPAGRSSCHIAAAPGGEAPGWGLLPRKDKVPGEHGFPGTSLWEGASDQDYSASERHPGSCACAPSRLLISLYAVRDGRIHSSIWRPRNAAATWVSLTSPSEGTAPLSGRIRHTEPVTSPEAMIGTATAA